MSCVCTYILIIKRQLMSTELKDVAFLETEFCLDRGCLTTEPPGQAALNLGEEGLRTNLRSVAFGFTFCANSCAALADFREFHWPLTRGV